MKTKTLIAMAAAAVVGGVSAFAQTPVYSQNIVGYVTLSQAAGKFKMICNPLKGSSVAVDQIFLNPVEGLTVYKQKTVGAGYDNVAFEDGAWNGTLNLAPGEGAFLQTPSTSGYTNTF